MKRSLKPVTFKRKSFPLLWIPIYRRNNCFWSYAYRMYVV